MINKEKVISDIDKQIAELQKQKIEVLENSKIEVKEKIEELLEKSGYSITDIFPDLIKKPLSLDVKHKVKINGKAYKLPKNGLGKTVEKALKVIGKNPNDYDRARVMKEFG